MRRLSDRARLEGMLALRRALDTVRRNQPTPASDEDAFRALYSARRDDDDATWWRRAELSRDDDQIINKFLVAEERVAAPPVDRDLELAKALDRIADSIERVAAQLDSYHHERAEHLDAIEFLLREMVISTVPATAPRSVVLGGVVDPDELDDDDSGITIIPDGYPLEVDAPVEVRSRFHDRWISGFSIAEAVETAGRCRYRLTRRSDGIPLPILFEACDVRAVSTFDRKHAPSSRSSVNESR
ncbi:MAG TPA: hypothetical protein VK771_09400 [Acidimicrobiia bacterium]|jgi:hypothetical protein|nr:hypothetical protein [Acidimicrobiia bacterium]